MSVVYDEKKRFRIVRIPFEGGNPEQITFNEGDHVWPESSPDGKWILYTEYVYVQGIDLFIISPEGGEPINFTRSTPILGLTDEIGVLADSFNLMVQRLKTSRDRLDAWGRDLESKVAERTTELEKSLHELEKAYKELETLDKTKDDFLSLVSHELRTPLNSVLLYSEMLLDGLADSEETRNEFLNTIVENCKRLTRLINDVLDLSKIEAGRMPFTIEELNVRDLVEETHHSLCPNLESHRIRFTCENAENVFLLGDRDKIIQVLTNIVSNAIKFTPEGGTISVSVTTGDELGEVAVTDTGKGIKKDDIPKVFDLFSQIESVDHHSSGTGLGMTISKSIIERLSGHIWIESEVNKGTTVFFTLPKAQGNPESVSEKELTGGTGKANNTDRRR